MKEYKVEVVRGDQTQELHLIRAASDVTALAEARALVAYMNRERPPAAQFKLQAIYDFRGVLVAAHF